MNNLDYLTDIDFLVDLVLDRNSKRYTRIIVLDKDEFPIESIEGRVTSGNISISGSSSVRRTCNLTFVAEEKNNDLTNVNNLLSINKKIKVEIGVENHINDKYDSIVWFKQGIFIIAQPSIAHNFGGVTITLSCKDKMCLLNGECAGGLPSSITFHEYDQYIGYQEMDALPSEPNEYTIYKVGNQYYRWSVTRGWTEISQSAAAAQRNQIEALPQRIYDIILTLVCNFGNESISNILISDVPLELKQLVRYIGTNPLYYNALTKKYTFDPSELVNQESWRSFGYNEDVGYIYTDFVYPGELISNIGESITSVLDKICNVLGNFEYFYDVDGHFVFREKKNYLNNSYNEATTYRLDNANREIEVDNQMRYLALAENDLYILDNLSYKIDFNSNSKRVFTFGERFSPVISYSNAPKYSNIKNDYHIWGKNKDGYAIHYHLAIKNKPTPLRTVDDVHYYNTYKVIYLTDNNGDYNGKLRLATEDETPEYYTPIDWRAELYMQGLVKQSMHQRPDVYEQELLDLFDGIYNMKEMKFKQNVSMPNSLNYFLDYLEPVTDIMDFTIEEIGRKTHSVQYDKIIKLFNAEVPNVIILNVDAPLNERESDIRRCELEGCPYSNVEDAIYKKLAIGTVGYSAEEKLRELLYVNTNYNESISIQTVPIYFLDVNTRITVQDSAADISGDYIINSISVPLDPRGTMSITASRALERI